MVAAVASFASNLALPAIDSDDFPFRLFKSISFCDIAAMGALLGFFVETIGNGGGGGTFLSIEKTALV